jgi:hypothetical protein
MLPQTVLAYRLLLIYGVLALACCTLAFASITILGRRHWIGLRTKESLLGRACGGAVVGLIAVGALSGVVTSLISSLVPAPPIVAASESQVVQAARFQTAVGILLTLALSIAAMASIERRHRRAAMAGPKDSGEQWEIEEPERGSHTLSR